MIPFKTLTANWPTDADETWWQNGDNDDNVDDVDDKEEDDDDDDDVDGGVGASSDDEKIIQKQKSGSETMYPKKDYFSFISISTVFRRKNNTAANKVASLLIFHCILDG